MWLLIGAAMLLGLLLGYVLIRLFGGQPLFGLPPYKALDLQAPEPMGNFTLTGPDGQEVSLRDFRDQVVVLYFGYTFCPDICPATMADLARAMDQLRDKEQEQIQVIMVTVDPERDTPEKLQEYLAHFNPTFIGLSGEPDEIDVAAALMGIYFERHEGTAASGYLVDHTATVSVLDKDGHLRLLFPFGTSADDMASDLRRLARE